MHVHDADRRAVPSRLVRRAFRRHRGDEEEEWGNRIASLPTCQDMRTAGFISVVANPLTVVHMDWACTWPTSCNLQRLTKEQRSVVCAWWRALHTFGGSPHPASPVEEAAVCGVAKVAFDHLRGTRPRREAFAAGLAFAAQLVSIPSPRPVLRLLDAALADGPACGQHTIPLLLLVWAMLQHIATSAHRLWVARGRPRITRRMAHRAKRSTRVRSFGPIAALALQDMCKAQCDVCDQRGVQMRRCGACGMGAYCSRTCQKRAWKKGHRHACLLWRAAVGKDAHTRTAAVHDMHM